MRYYLERAQKVHAISPTDDEAMLEHILEILAEIGPAKVMYATIWKALSRSMPLARQMIRPCSSIYFSFSPRLVPQR